MKTNYLTLAVVAILAISFTACELDNKRPKDVDYELLAADANVSESINSDAYRIVDQESRSGNFSDSIGKNLLRHGAMGIGDGHLCHCNVEHQRRQLPHDAYHRFWQWLY